ncbi:DNA repair protein RecO [candidate division WOR-1 bacterium RIFOXYC2_FULL_37_10]|uniref:DNA repair protein RecO n=1 Tax=candidate division WOR-1 bacterium RIFOXYB2_FULL_37_13 TaxID=1802579 RepID=A0A1F4SRV7_UNCSA|nr:MAG: DNA repair protein RecO [candidate division WOR-1 bacterium RIFOXYB2_FULL_37_13]OGC35385.1 MAG: DNA repair protein RecO [candidate division WOR-1 bacterium RIFOXYC2_FULL_37_10]
MAIYKTKGIVLKARPFDESAKIITIFTIDFGKVNVIAKGAKRPNSKFGGRLEPLNVLELSVAKGRNLDILSQCETIENYSGIKNKHDKLDLAFYFLKVIYKATDDYQQNKNLFRLLVFSLKKLNDGNNLLDSEKYFEVNFLRVEGLFRAGYPPDILIGEHLGEDVRLWKR